MSRLFELLYLLRFTPWERSEPPPELVALVEGPTPVAPGKALDLGCGAGAQSVYLAAHGWDVTGVDLVARAIRRARKRARMARVDVRFVEGDVTDLARLNIGAGYSLILDIGCLHTIPPARRDAYAAGVHAAADEDAVLLSMAFGRSTRGPLPPGISTEEMQALFPGWTIESEHPDPGDSGIGPMKTAHPTWRLLRRRRDA